MTIRMHFLLFLSLIIVTLPRFNRNDWGFVKLATGKDHYSYQTSKGVIYQGLPRDVVQYLQYVEYIRGENPSPPSAPFTYRPLVPLLASLLPLDPMSSINSVNVLLLGVGIVFFFVGLRGLGFSPRTSFIGCLIFIISFPTFYYATIGFVDGSLMGILLVAVSLISKKQPVLLIALALLGLLIKETAIIMLPIAVTLEIQNYMNLPAPRKRHVSIAVIFFPIVLIGFYALLRAAAPGDSAYFWSPSVSVFYGNMVNPRMYITFVLTLAIPGILAALGLKQLVRRKADLSPFLPLFVGAVMSLLLFFYSMLSAHSDGRFLWTSYPFLIPLGLFALRKNELNGCEASREAPSELLP